MFLALRLCCDRIMWQEDETEEHYFLSIYSLFLASVTGKCVFLLCYQKMSWNYVLCFVSKLATLVGLVPFKTPASSTCFSKATFMNVCDNNLDTFSDKHRRRSARRSRSAAACQMMNVCALTAQRDECSSLNRSLITFVTRRGPVCRRELFSPRVKNICQQIYTPFHYPESAGMTRKHEFLLHICPLCLYVWLCGDAGTQTNNMLYL